MGDFMQVQFGWKAGTEQYPPEELLQFAVAAEEAGFDSIDVSDHFHPWAERGQACFAWTWLGAAAAKTKRIILGTGVTCPILRYHPSIIAQAAATMARLVPRRFFLGVGTGEALNEYSATGRWPAYKTRQTQMVEAIDLIRKLWSGEVVSHRGEYYETRQAKLYTRSVDPIPLYISAMVPNSARIAGNYGDGLITVGGEAPEHYHALLENFAAGAKEAGKNPDTMPRIIELAADFADDEEKAIATRKAYWAGVFIPALFTERIYTPKMSETNGQAVGADTIRQSVCISADAEVHMRYAKHYIDLGFDHLIFHAAGPDQSAFIEQYGRLVLPQLRKKK
jgi:coenzyme F420-dependent glucose-6-phosphate dehydrogenase